MIHAARHLPFPLEQEATQALRPSAEVLAVLPSGTLPTEINDPAVLARESTESNPTPTRGGDGLGKEVYGGGGGGGGPMNQMNCVVIDNECNHTKI